MKISLSWLQQYLKVDLSSDEISVLLTDIGLEVEGILHPFPFHFSIFQ